MTIAMWRQTERSRIDWAAVSGTILVLPPLAFITVAVAKHNLGVTHLAGVMDYMAGGPGGDNLASIISPFLFLGGLLAALIINAHRMVSLRIQSKANPIAITIALEPKSWNLSVAVVSSALLTIMLGYAVVENLAGH